MHLHDHGVETLKLSLFAQPLNELHGKPAPVQVRIEVKQVRLEEHLAATECRSCAQAGNAGQRSRADTSYSDSENAVERSDAAMNPHVRGGKTKLASQTFATNHLAMH